MYVLSILLGMLIGIIAWALRYFIQWFDHVLPKFFVHGALYHLSVIQMSILVSISLAFLAWISVRLIAPEAAGSGVQEIEGALLHQRSINWHRLLPVKFFGGVAVLASKMLLGREGPTIQIGGNCGAMFGDIFRLDHEHRDCLIAAGAAAGLAAAFFAPLAGIIFVLEEMRNQFSYSVLKFKIVFMSCVMSTIVLYFMSGVWPAFVMPIFQLPGISSFMLFFLLGLVVGIFGWIYNSSMLKGLNLFSNLHGFFQLLFLVTLAGFIGYLRIDIPLFAGEGFNAIEEVLYNPHTLNNLVIVGLMRFFLGCCCYSVGVPGGIFSPLLALGTLLGLIFFHIFGWWFDLSDIKPGMFALAGMGAILATTVQAPVTGLILVIEITHNYSMMLPLMISCLSATLVAQIQKNPPIYHQLLKRVLSRQSVVNLD
jgi:CIC family chloride channel protein